MSVGEVGEFGEVGEVGEVNVIVILIVIVFLGDNGCCDCHTRDPRMLCIKKSILAGD